MKIDGEIQQYLFVLQLGFTINLTQESVIDRFHDINHIKLKLAISTYKN